MGDGGTPTTPVPLVDPLCKVFVLGEVGAFDCNRTRSFWAVAAGSEMEKNFIASFER